MNFENSLIIKNINILSMKDKAVQHNKTIVISDGLIEDIRENSDNLDNRCKTVDGKGLYIMPGLINMHTHLGDNKDDLMLYLVNGVTSIRNMWGYEKFRLKNWIFGTRVFNHLELKNKIEKGEIEGPNIYTAGPVLDGDPPFFPEFMFVEVINEKNLAKDVVKKQYERGYDFIKIYSMLSKKSFDNIIQAAREYGMPVVGHVPDRVGVENAVMSGMHSVEHLYGFINPYKPQLNMPKKDIRRIVSLIVKNNVWNCPTLIANYRLSNIDKQEEFEKEEQMKYISKRNKKGMRFLIKASAKLYLKKGLRGNHEYMEDYYSIIKIMKEQGAGILLGTDKATPYVVAGFSEHIEMQLLKNAGLSNYEILKAATVDAAKCLKKERELGTVETGKKADLILTEKNPMEDLKTIQEHRGVVKSGRFYSREKCNEILKGIKKRIKYKKDSVKNFDLI